LTTETDVIERRSVTVGRFAIKRESALTEHRYNATVRCGVDFFLPHRKTPRGLGILAHVSLDSQPLPNRVPDNGAFLLDPS
jgi:hypothetical protein